MRDERKQKHDHSMYLETTPLDLPHYVKVGLRLSEVVNLQWSMVLLITSGLGRIHSHQSGDCPLDYNEQGKQDGNSH